MRQHLGGRYGPEFNVARNWLNAGRPLDGPRPGAIGVKAHHVFQVIRVVDRDHVLAISGNDHNDVRSRIRPTSDVIGGVTLPTKALRLASLLLIPLPPTSPQQIRLVQTRVRMTPAHKALSGPSASVPWAGGGDGPEPWNSPAHSHSMRDRRPKFASQYTAATRGP